MFATFCCSLKITSQCYAAMSCRQSSPDLAESHVQALHKLVMSMAHCCDTYQPTGDVKLEPADQHMASHTLQQLTQLTAHLLQAMPLHPRQQLAQTLLSVRQLVPDAYHSILADMQVVFECLYSLATIPMPLLLGNLTQLTPASGCYRQQDKILQQHTGSGSSIVQTHSDCM